MSVEKPVNQGKGQSVRKVRGEKGMRTAANAASVSPEPQGATPGVKGPAGQRRGCGTVLVVDDEELICRIACQMVARMGFEVLSGTSGKQALELFRAHKSDVVAVIIDEGMPEMNGPEVFAEMQKLKPGVRALICSGYPESEVMSRMEGKGFAGFLQKPFTVNSITDKLMAVV